MTGRPAAVPTRRSGSERRPAKNRQPTARPLLPSTTRPDVAASASTARSAGWCRAPRSGPNGRCSPPPPTSGCSRPRVTPDGCTPTRGGSCGSSRSSSRASAPWPSRPGDQRLRLGAHPEGSPDVRRRPGDRAWAGRAGVRGDHRGWSGDHGGGEPGRQPRRGHLDRARHRTAVRDDDEPAREPRHQLPVLLRPQGDVPQVRAGVRRHARAATAPSTNCSRPSPWPRPAR